MAAAMKSHKRDTGRTSLISHGTSCLPSNPANMAPTTPRLTRSGAKRAARGTVALAGDDCSGSQAVGQERQLLYVRLWRVQVTNLNWCALSTIDRARVDKALSICYFKLICKLSRPYFCSALLPNVIFVLQP